MNKLDELLKQKDELQKTLEQVTNKITKIKEQKNNKQSKIDVEEFLKAYEDSINFKDISEYFDFFQKYSCIPNKYIQSISTIDSRQINRNIFGCNYIKEYSYYKVNDRVFLIKYVHYENNIKEDIGGRFIKFTGFTNIIECDITKKFNMYYDNGKKIDVYESLPNKFKGCHNCKFSSYIDDFYHICNLSNEKTCFNKFNCNLNYCDNYKIKEGK